MTSKLLAQTIRITGPDAVTFAHAQFSSRVSSLVAGQWQFSAWLDARGRVQALFHLARCDQETLVMLLRGGNAPTVAASLRRLVFRSRVSIEADAPRELCGGPAMPLQSVDCGQGMLAFGCGDHSLHVTVPLAVAEGIHDKCWRMLQLRAGWPWLPDTALGEWLAPDLSLQRLQAVVMDKGCYPGQEIVARMHFRGIHKHHLCNVGLSTPMHVGQQLRVAGRDAGCILDVVDVGVQSQALAVLDDEAIGNLRDGRPDIQTATPVVRLDHVWPA